MSNPTHKQTGPRQHKVLILSGGYLTEKDNSLWQVLQKQRAQQRHTVGAWLDLKLKTLTAEPVFAFLVERFKLIFFRQGADKQVRRMLRHTDNSDTPGLTEAVLAGLLSADRIAFELAAIAELFSDKPRINKLLEDCDCVFLSTTYLRDLSEIKAIIPLIHRQHNRIVVGGALTTLLDKQQWLDVQGIDVIATGYGEHLVPALAQWIHSGYQRITAPDCGNLYRLGTMFFLSSGYNSGSKQNDSHSLDHLPRPDWSAVFDYHQKHFAMIYYESVRGCPYRCSFCNYPNLFAERKFRFFSAQRMAADWEFYYQRLGIEYITCLDSLFTTPKRRLQEFCELLIEKNLPVKWICYARADDLTDEQLVKLLKQAGAIQVQIGLESGDPEILNNMNKQCSIANNARAIANCRKHGITTVVSLIVGFPGETRESLENTYEFLRSNPPDFYYLAAFSVRAGNIPVLEPENRSRFSLDVADNSHTMAPYWRHKTMDCLQATDHIRRLNQRLMREGVSLNAVLFYKMLLHYSPREHNALIAYQKRIACHHPLLTYVFDGLNRWINRRLQTDMTQSLNQDNNRSHGVTLPGDMHQ